MCLCLRVAIVFLCVVFLCVVCASRMWERRRDIIRAAGEGAGGSLASDGWELYFHINHIGVGVAACAMSEFNVGVWCSLWRCS